MVNKILKIDLAELRSGYEGYDSKREKLIKQGRVALKSAKQLGYAIHRGNKSECSKLEKELKKEFTSLRRIEQTHEKLKYEGSFNEASEEYGESMLYYDYVFRTSLRSPEDLKISNEAYLGGLADLSGELGRRCVQLAIKGQYDEIHSIREFVGSLFKELMNFSFRNSSLRKKFDSVKWNLNKIEDILYDVEIKGKR